VAFFVADPDEYRDTFFSIKKSKERKITSAPELPVKTIVWSFIGGRKNNYSNK